ncbi:LLM class flavin-dependent oxidoreductase [Pseudolabrys taiwanensis]|uniref:Luciferase-like monooxygenase n=1 Tax=Pseudolabrys taiwanensis TaxID=331696 RepID=A0A345ZYZ5_9HYPH|nr:LLM class flavin-dependent oxidoreductase [Pseudolabrys taiwanensis]AXK82142.1 LLM class flavin-dependent oxidoreductase [Pseudolabrys taiwanensis]
MIPLSVLDLSPVAAGSTGAQALRNSLDLAQLADRLGFTRYWVAEHHNMPAIASSAPDIMIGQIAAATERLRVGSGGVMLPNHAPLTVAERFKVLEALYPDRIDLGLGRAPGTDPATSYALRRRQGISEEDDFLERFNELMLFETNGFPAGHPFHKVRAMPADVKLPPIYLLGSSDYSAQLSGHIGAAFAFAHHFASFDAATAMRIYRDSFKPSVSHTTPYAILATHVVCAETDEEAERLAATVDLNIVRRAKGEYQPLASPEEALAYDYAPVDRARIAENRRRLSVGSPATVKARLAPLLEATQANELMVTTMIYDHAARKRSYELLADVFK